MHAGPDADRVQVGDMVLGVRGHSMQLAQTDAQHLEGMIGSEQTILVENNGLAHTENFTLVDAAGLKARALVPVTITGHNGKHLTMQVKQMAAA